MRNSDRVDGLWHEPVEVGVALAVSMRTHVDRHVIDKDCHVGAMVEVVAAQEVLVCFTLAAVLGDDEPRSRFEDFARARNGARVKFVAGHGELAGEARGDHRPAARVGRPIGHIGRSWRILGARGLLGWRFLGRCRRDRERRKLRLAKCSG